jgi:hypothetical protein
MSKKTIMPAMIVAVTAALAAPAVATAGVWKHHGQAIQQNQQIQLTGQTKWSGGPVGSIECQVTTTVTLEAGQQTGTVTQYDVDVDQAGSTVTSKCSANGFLVGCQLHVLQSTELPWVVHNETQRLQITSGDIDYTLTGAFCSGQRATMTPSNPASSHFITWTPNQTKTVTSFTEAGQIAVDIYNGQQLVSSATAGTSGTLTILAPNSHTFSLE